mmetsp:Transcript_34708/g.73604  ORF Transcript_34708/g.73604 Transcript_34708/m.73604 type:complete len:205 (-) Transcript_34708:61-675(-)
MVHQKLGVNILIVDYRGYGDSDDHQPTEKGLIADAIGALDWLDRKGVKQLIIFGRSLGGAVAFALAEHMVKQGRQPAGLIAENTFVSVSKMARSIFPFLKWLSWLLRPPAVFDDWNTAQRIVSMGRSAQFPILFLGGQRDEIVPPVMMVQLNDLVTQHSAGRVHFEKFPNGTHNDTPLRDFEQYWRCMVYWHQLLTSPPTAASG